MFSCYDLGLEALGSWPVIFLLSWYYVTNAFVTKSVGILGLTDSANNFSNSI